jgi:hypothetical protein
MQITSLDAHDTRNICGNLTEGVHSRQEPLKGSDRARKGVARWVAGVLVGSLCLLSAETSEAQLVPNKELRLLANKQLTDKQYKCHNEIVYRESRFNINAVNGSHHGYYQMRSKSMQGKPYDYQFYVYWYYVAKRYGFDKSNPELPDYCSALHHLRTRGWQ